MMSAAILSAQLMQTPASHSTPEQHGRVGVPQTWQLPVLDCWQVVMSRQVEPAAQQMVLQQVPGPVVQLPPAQQGWPAPPHTMQVPLMQT